MRFALLLCFAASPVAAQMPFDGCVDRSDRPVRSIINNDMSWAGTATEVNGESVIYWNRVANARASRTTQIFIYLHECAHHTLGHIWKPQAARWELEAECWAVQLMWEGGMIQGRHLRLIEEELRTSRGDATHLGGEARTQSLRDCIQIKTNRKAWSASLTALLDASADSFASIQGQAVPRPSSLTGVYESEVDLPGTYDCEITQTREVRCVVFAARTARRVADRFKALTGIIGAWLPPGWTAVDSPPGDSTTVRIHAAKDTIAGRGFTLSATTGHQIVFVMQPVRSAVDSFAAHAPPPETIAFRKSEPVGQIETPPAPVAALPLGAAVRVQVRRLGPSWIGARVVRTAGATPCLLFQLQRTDAAGNAQLVFLRGVSAIEIEIGGAWKPVDLDAVRRQDAGCRR